MNSLHFLGPGVAQGAAGFALGFFALLVTGWGFSPSRRLARNAAERLVEYLALGSLWVSLYTLALLLGHIPLSALSLCPLPLAAFAKRAWRERGFARFSSFNMAVSRPSWRQVAVGILALIGVALVAWWFWKAFGATVSAPPGVGIWGYKAKYFYLTGGFDRALFAEPEYAFNQPSYPLEFPLVVTWLYGWIGRVNDGIVCAVPAIYLTAVLAAMLSMRSVRLAPAAGALALVLLAGVSARIVAGYFYAEPLLILTAWAAWQRLSRAPRDRWGWLLLGSCAWIKNEGLLILLAALAAFLLFERGSRKALLRAALPGIAIALPWRIAAKLLGASTGDFHWTLNPSEFSWPTLPLALQKAAKWLFLDPGAFGWVWWAFLVVAAGGIFFYRRRWDRAISRAIAWILFMMAGYLGVFLFSALDDADWHTDALLRLALLPSCLVWYCIARLMAKRPRQASRPRAARIFGWGVQVAAVMLAVYAFAFHQLPEIRKTSERTAQRRRWWQKSGTPYWHGGGNYHEVYDTIERHVGPTDTLGVLPPDWDLSIVPYIRMLAAYSHCPQPVPMLDTDDPPSQHFDWIFAPAIRKDECRFAGRLYKQVPDDPTDELFRFETEISKE